MRKVWLKIRYVLLVLLFVGILGWLYTYYYTDYPAFVDSSAATNYPMVSWNAIVDGRVVRSLERQAEQGKLNGFEDAVVPILKFSSLNPENFDDAGVDLVEIESTIVRSPLYGDVTKRPFVTVAYYQTMIGEERYYLIYQRWRSVDGGESYVQLILPEKKVIEEEGLTQYYKNLIASDASHMLSPIMRLSASSFCIINVWCQTICTTVAPSADSSFTRQWITAK